MNNTSVVTLAFAVASAVLVTTSQKVEAFTISGDWSYNSTEFHASKQIFYGVKNTSSQEAFDFHIKYSDKALESRGVFYVQNYDFFNGIESGGTVTEQDFSGMDSEGKVPKEISIETGSYPDGNFHAYWTDKNHNPVPEPVTIFGSATALGFIPLFKKAYLRRQKKSKKID